MAVQSLFSVSLLLWICVSLSDARCDVGSSKKSKCDCGILYDCTAMSPSLDIAKSFRDLAPTTFPITAPRGRKNAANAKSFCHDRCLNRAAAFLRFVGFDVAVTASPDKETMTLNALGADILCDYAAKHDLLTISIQPLSEVCGFWIQSQAEVCTLSESKTKTSYKLGDAGCWIATMDARKVGFGNFADPVYEDFATGMTTFGTPLTTLDTMTVTPTEVGRISATTTYNC